jgi:hypothetical protein
MAVNMTDWSVLVKKEESLRLSEEIQEQYKNFEKDESYIDWITFTATIQKRVLSEAGLSPNEFNLRKLREAAQFTNPPVFWVKFNRARRGPLVPLSPLPDNLYLYDTSELQNIEMCSLSTKDSGRLHMIIAGLICLYC